jgi:hypothetical protein
MPKHVLPQKLITEGYHLSDLSSIEDDTITYCPSLMFSLFIAGSFLKSLPFPWVIFRLDRMR